MENNYDGLRYRTYTGSMVWNGSGILPYGRKAKEVMAYIAQATKNKGIHKRKMVYSSKKGHAYHWTYVIRAKDPEKRELIALDMERAVKKAKYIKYSNASKKNAKLYDNVKKYGFNCLKLKKKSTTNCINLASVAFNFAGIKTPRKSTARTAPSKWVEAHPDELERIKYVHGKTKLIRGDMLDATIKPKVHAAVYL